MDGSEEPGAYMQQTNPNQSSPGAGAQQDKGFILPKKLVECGEPGFVECTLLYGAEAAILENKKNQFQLNNKKDDHFLRVRPLRSRYPLDLFHTYFSFLIFLLLFFRSWARGKGFTPSALSVFDI